MPTVPRPERQVARQELPGVRLTAAATPESEGAGIAEAQGQQGQALAGVGAKTEAFGEHLYADVLEKERQRANQTAILAADTGLGQWVTKRVYDPQTGALQVKGMDAQALPEQVRDEFNQHADQIEAGLSTPDQKLAFRRIRAERGLSLDHVISQHTLAESEQYEGQVVQAALVNSRNFAIASSDNPRQVGLELQRQRDAIAVHGKHLGWSADAIKEQQDANVSATHVGVIEKMLAEEKTKAAQVYFEEAQAKNQINGDQIARIEKALQEGTLRKQSQQVSDAILSGSYGVRADGSNKGEGYFGALKRPDGNFSSELSIGVEIDGKEIDIPALVPTLTDKEVKTLLNQAPDEKIPDSIVEKATAYAKTRIAAGKSPFAGAGEASKTLAPSVDRATPEPAQRPATLRAALDQAKAIDDPKLRDEVSARIEHAWSIKEVQQREDDEAASKAAFNILDRYRGDITKIPTTTWASFSGGTKSALRSYGEHLAKGDPVETDWPTYYGLMTKAGNAPADFANENLLGYRAKLGNGEFKQLTDLQLAIRNKDANALDKTAPGFRDKEQIVNDTLTQYGIDPKAKPDTDEGKAIAQLRRMLDQRIDAAQAGGAKKVTNTEMQQTLDGLLGQNVTTPGSWWGTWFGHTFFGSTQKRLLDVTAADIPQAERATIEKAIRDSGRTVSDATVLDTYLNVLVRRNYKARK